MLTLNPCFENLFAKTLANFFGCRRGHLGLLALLACKGALGGKRVESEPWYWAQ